MWEERVGLKGVILWEIFCTDNSVKDYIFLLCVE